MLLHTTCLLVVLHLSEQTSYAQSYGQKGDYCGCCSGPPGLNGASGINGLPGRPGEQGAKGQKGDTGDVGNPGVKGEFGRKGSSGKKGNRGYKGQKGECGPQGFRGDKGDHGLTGSMGLKGSKGQQGEKGQPPAKIAFSAGRRFRLGPVSQDTIITFDNVFVNIGGSFDVYTSHFVCKVNATYIFTTHILSQEDHDAYAWIMVNSRHTMPLHGDPGYGTGSNTVILHLLKDDHVWVQLSKNSTLMNDYSTFSGHILFED